MDKLFVLYFAFILLLFSLHLVFIHVSFSFTTTNTTGDGCMGGKMDARSMSMSSVGKVVYETVHRSTGGGLSDVETRSTNNMNLSSGSGAIGSNSCSNQQQLVYCPSPYATTRVSLYFPDHPNQSSLTTNGCMERNIEHQNCYDMPLLKQARITSSWFISRYPFHSIISLFFLI